MQKRLCSISVLLLTAGHFLVVAALQAQVAESAAKGTLLIRPTTESGQRRLAKGTLKPASGRSIPVNSQRPNIVPAGLYLLEVGIATLNGTIYRPTAANVSITGGIETIVDVKVVDPPTVAARFMENGAERKPGEYFRGRVTAYRDGEEAFSFRPGSRVPIEEGSYEFRISPNPENQDLTATATIAAGENRVVEFEMVHTVRVKITLAAAGSGIEFPKNVELWQDGAKVKDVHRTRGAWAVPGTYDVYLADALTPYLHKGVALEPGTDNEIRLEMPVGHLEVMYQRANGSARRGGRFWLSRLDANDPGVELESREIRGAQVQIPLPPGRYRIEGWEPLGTFDPVEIEIEVGEDQEIALRDKS